MTLKADLINIDKLIQQGELDNLIESMLKNIRSTDPELRDSLIYNSFGKLILEDHLTEKQMNHILEVCLRNLFLDIGKQEDDSVFTRSFSALVIALVIEKDREKRFLSDDILNQTFEDSVKYLKLEADIRGYVPEEGWAHSIAHGADLLAEVVRHPKFDMELASEYLEVVKLCLFKDSSTELPFVDDEEERLLFVVEALQEKGMPEGEIENWVLEISDELTNVFETEEYSLNFFRKRKNVVNFLRSYYFRLSYEDTGLKLREKIVVVLKEWHEKVYL